MVSRSSSIDRQNGLNMAANIQEYVAERGINYLVHFTREANLASILENGLLRRDLLIPGAGVVFNDELRLDGTSAICLSISFPNYKLFCRLRNSNPDEKWVVIGLHPSVLWMLRCAFCTSNAASSAVTGINIEQRMGLGALQAMFVDWEDKVRANLGLNASVPTNPQAEVLVLDSIPRNFIVGVAASNESTAQRLRVSHPGANVLSFPNFFYPRADYQHWQAS